MNDTTAKLIDQFLKDMSPEDCRKAIEHIRETVCSVDIENINLFVKNFDYRDPFDGIMGSSINTLLTESFRLYRDLLKNDPDKRHNMMGTEVGKILIRVLREMTTCIESQINEIDTSQQH